MGNLVSLYVISLKITEPIDNIKGGLNYSLDSRTWISKDLKKKKGITAKLERFFQWNTLQEAQGTLKQWFTYLWKMSMRKEMRCQIKWVCVPYRASRWAQRGAQKGPVSMVWEQQDKVESVGLLQALHGAMWQMLERLRRTSDSSSFHDCLHPVFTRASQDRQWCVISPF